MAAADPLAAKLAAIREREQAATPGPWTLETDYGDAEYVHNPEFPYAFVMPEPHTERPAGEERHEWDYRYSEVSEMTMGTAEFLLHARTDIPRLLAAVEAALAHIRSGDDHPQDGEATILAALTGKDAAP